MRRFILQVVVDTISLVGAILILRLLSVSQPFPFGTSTVPIVQAEDSRLIYFVIAGLGLTVGNMVIRPVIVAFTGRFLLWSFGLFSVVITAIVLIVVGRFSPLQLEIAAPWLLWVLVGSGLVQLFDSVLNAILGLTRPSAAPSRRMTGVWSILDALPTPRRNAIIENLRLQQVYDTLIRFGVEITVDRTPLRRIRLWSETHLLRETDPIAGLTPPQKVAVMLQQLGPTYVKIGQMAASQGASLPPEWADELARLQSDVAPFPWEQARDIIAKQLGRPPEELFATIDQEPFAAASTAQVHRATLADGTELAVKVQRPDIQAMTKADLGVMQEVSRVMERRSSFARKVGVHAIVTEFASGVLRELDYRNEAYQARRLQDGMAKFGNVGVPNVYGDLSGERVLTMEFIRGIKISHVAELDAAGLDKVELGRAFIRALIKQVLIDGFFHGDPHPGNLFVVPETGRIVFIDCGLVGQLDSQQRTDLLDLIYSLKVHDFDSVATVVIRLSTRSRGLRRGRLPDRARSQAPPVPRLRRPPRRLDRPLIDALDGLQQRPPARPQPDDGDQGHHPGLRDGGDHRPAHRHRRRRRRSRHARRSSPSSPRRRSGRPPRRRPSRSARSSSGERRPSRRRPGAGSTSSAGASWSWRSTRPTSVTSSRSSTPIGRRLTTGMIVVGQLIGTAIFAVVTLQPADGGQPRASCPGSPSRRSWRRWSTASTSCSGRRPAAAAAIATEATRPGQGPGAGRRAG